MRQDFDKVVTERPRHGARLKQPKGYKKQMSCVDEDAPRKEKIRQKWIANWNDGKQFSDLIGPLRRWIRSKVGQNWDDVYSEIRQVLSPKSLTQNHIWGHIEQYVERNVIMIDGKPCHGEGFLYGTPIHQFSRNEGFYVHPETNILLEAPKNVSKKVRKTFSDVIEIDDSNLLKKLDGIWYWIEVREYKQQPYFVTHRFGNKVIYSGGNYDPHYDMVHRVSVTGPYGASKLYGRAVVPISKRQLNKREIKKLVA